MIPTPGSEQWVHALDPWRHPVGSVFGWSDADSPTGFWSGIVVEVDSLGLRVRVRDIQLGVMNRG